MRFKLIALVLALALGSFVAGYAGGMLAWHLWPPKTVEVSSAGQESTGIRTARGTEAYERWQRLNKEVK